MSLVGVKIKDGLFAGDSDSANDFASAMACKVSRVVNCCATEIVNHWEKMGITYLSYKWEDNSGQIILDTNDNTINEVFDFIEVALQKEESVLIHSNNGQSRCVCVLAAYMMKRYRWSMRKVMEFLKTRGLGEEMKFGFINQLKSYEKRLHIEEEAQPLAEDWSKTTLPLDSCELLIRNTFVNVRDLAASEHSDCSTPSPSSRSALVRRPSWKDAEPGGVLVEAQEAEEPRSPLSMMCVAQEKPKPIGSPNGPLKSALKGASSKVGPELKCAASTAASEATALVQRGSSQVQISIKDIVPKRFGLKLRCSSIILEYEVPSRGLRAHHVIKVELADSSDKATATSLQKLHPHWLEGVSVAQLSDLVGRLRKGHSVLGGS